MDLCLTRAMMRPGRSRPIWSSPSRQRWRIPGAASSSSRIRLWLLKRVARSSAIRGTAGTGQDLAWVHDVIRVDRRLDRVHHVYRLAVLGEQEIYLAAADPVLACARAVKRESALNKPLVEPFSLGHLLRFVRVEHESDMKIAVSGMSDNPCRQERSSNVFLCLGDALSQPGDRHADIGSPALPARPGCLVCHAVLGTVELHPKRGLDWQVELRTAND